MTTHEYGVRIGAGAALRAGATAAVLDGDRLLLTRRSDNGEWCLPGGGIDPGERPAEAAGLTVIANHRPLLPTAYGVAGIYFDAATQVPRDRTGGR